MQKIILIGEKDHFKKNKPNMKNIFKELQIQPDLIFTEGNGKNPVQRTYNPFQKYLDERKKLDLPHYITIDLAFNRNYNKERELEGNLMSVEDLKLSRLQTFILQCSSDFALEKYDEMKDINKIDILLNDFQIMKNISKEILDLKIYNTNEKEITLIELIMLDKMLNNLEKTYVKRDLNEMEETKKEIASLILKNINKVLLNERNEIFYENIKNNIRDEKNIVVFVGDAHSEYLKRKLSPISHIEV
jgi:hypothetical protein